MAYATGKHSLAICDRCGFRYKYTQLRKEWTGFFVCSECYEPKEPQLDPVPHVADPEALRNPRTQVPSSLVAGEGVVRTIDANSMMTTTGDSIGSAFSMDAATGEIGTVTTTQNVPANIATPDGVSATARVGSVSVTTNTEVDVEVTGVASTASLGTVTVTSNVTTYTITVVGGNPSNHPYYNVGSTNKFAIDGSTATADVTLSLSEGSTYRFDQSDSSNSGHPLRFSTTANGTHGGGSEYTTGVTTNGTPGSSGAYTQITVASGAPTLYYYCTNHSAMGWTANTP